MVSRAERCVRTPSTVTALRSFSELLLLGSASAGLAKAAAHTAARIAARSPARRAWNRLNRAPLSGRGTGPESVPPRRLPLVEREPTGPPDATPNGRFSVAGRRRRHELDMVARGVPDERPRRAPRVGA